MPAGSREDNHAYRLLFYTPGLLRQHSAHHFLARPPPVPSRDPRFHGDGQVSAIRPTSSMLILSKTYQ